MNDRWQPGGKHHDPIAPGPPARATMVMTVKSEAADHCRCGDFVSVDGSKKSGEKTS